jgi:putative ABC transport system permease protein
MISNGLKIFFRRIASQKVFFGINQGGLTIGLTFAILAFLYAQNEFRYDKFFTNTNDTYLLACNNGRIQKMHSGQPPVFMDEILKNVPEVTAGMRLKWSDENMLINEKRMEAIDFLYADSTFFNFLGWNLIVGNPKEVLSKPMMLTISEKMAKQLFPDENPIGQIVNLGNESNFMISGIFKDFPKESNIHSDFIASLSSWQTKSKSMLQDWGWHSSSIYLKFSPNADIQQVEKKIADVWNRETKDDHCKGDYIRAKLQPFQDNYLKSGEITGNADPLDFVIGFSLIAALILVISCFNFINLSIAINAKRSLEHSLKKALGANIKLFIRQVFLEISLYLAFAILLSSLFIRTLLPLLNSFLGKHLALSFVGNLGLDIYVLLLSGVLMIICGISPVLQITRTGNNGLQKRSPSYFAFVKDSSSQKGFRNSLVITQFAIGIILITSSIVVNRQLKLIMQHDTGFDREQTLVIDNYEGKNESRYLLFAEALKKYPEVVSVSCGSNVPSDGVSNWGSATVVGDELKKMEGCGFISVDYGYLELIGAKLTQGRNFTANKTSDIDQVIITEAMAQTLKLDNPVGTFLTDMWDDKRREIIGVVKDIEFNTIHDNQLAIAFFCQRTHYTNFHKQILVKLKTKQISGILTSIDKQWKQIAPEYPLTYRFLDDIFNENYQKEVKTGVLLSVMAMIALVLCCMGLFALALFHINARIKEIGIRKVNGATVLEVMTLLNQNFIKWILIATIIAIPVAWYAMHRWLENFAYKTELSWWIFAISGILALGIALLTVSWQSWKAATRNPVESLKYE